MFEEVMIRERKSVKYGKTYEYRFEIAPIDGERKWLSKGGFLSEEEAKEAAKDERKAKRRAYWKKGAWFTLTLRSLLIVMGPILILTLFYNINYL